MKKENKPKLYHNFWDSFDIRLYKKIVEVKRKKEDLKAHLKFFVI